MSVSEFRHSWLRVPSDAMPPTFSATVMCRVMLYCSLCRFYRLFKVVLFTSDQWSWAIWPPEAENKVHVSPRCEVLLRSPPCRTGALSGNRPAWTNHEAKPHLVGPFRRQILLQLKSWPIVFLDINLLDRTKLGTLLIPNIFALLRLHPPTKHCSRPFYRVNYVSDQFSWSPWKWSPLSTLKFHVVFIMTSVCIFT